MGNPLRFYGTGEPIELDGFTLPPRCAVEVTFRAHQERFLLRPDKTATEILLGCLGRAYDRYPSLNLHVISVLSNHGCFVASPENPGILSSFMRDFLSTAATRLNLVRGRDGTFWERRYRAIPITDDAKLEERFAYTLLQGTKENLVWNPRDWPGVSSVGALTGQQFVGRWRDRKTEYERKRQLERKQARARASGRQVPRGKIAQIWLEYPIELHPLPHWKGWKKGQRRAHVAELVRADAEDTKRRHTEQRTRPLGISAILATDPTSRPANPKQSPAPRVHAASRLARSVFLEAYQLFVETVRGAADRLRDAAATFGVPAGLTIPPLSLANASRRRPGEPTVLCFQGCPTGPPSNG